LIAWNDDVPLLAFVNEDRRRYGLFVVELNVDVEIDAKIVDGLDVRGAS